jgi:hypothetical protein
MTERDCSLGRDRCRLASACTIRTTRQAVRHIRRDDSAPLRGGDAGGVRELPHSMQKPQAQPLQLRVYASLLLVPERWDFGGREDRFCDQESRTTKGRNGNAQATREVFGPTPDLLALSHEMWSE